MEPALVLVGFASDADGVGSAVDSCGGTDSGDERTEVAVGCEVTLDGATLPIADGATDSGTRSGGI